MLDIIINDDVHTGGRFLCKLESGDAGVRGGWTKGIKSVFPPRNHGWSIQAGIDKLEDHRRLDALR